MLFKKCYSCKKLSYSSSSDNKWICPYCGEDITNETATVTGLEHNGTAYDSIDEDQYQESSYLEDENYLENFSEKEEEEEEEEEK